jgi:hypothetical protein
MLPSTHRLMSPPYVRYIAQRPGVVARTVFSARVAHDRRSMSDLLHAEATGTAKAPLHINFPASGTLHPLLVVHNQPLNCHGPSVSREAQS